MVPGTRASRRPPDPNDDAVEKPFVISVENGAIRLELVAHVDGVGKSAYGLAVLQMKRAAAAEDEGGRRTDQASGGGVSHDGEETRERADDTGGNIKVALTLKGSQYLDGVHGAPVFLGKQLLGFALQVRASVAEAYIKRQWTGVRDEDGV